MPGRLIDSREEIEELAKAVLAGRRRIVAWGAIRHLAAFAWRAPWPFAYIIDRDNRRWGRREAGYHIVGPQKLNEENPERTVVALLPFAEPYGADIIGEIRARGEFDILIPWLAVNEFAPAREPVPCQFDSFLSEDWVRDDRRAVFQRLLGATPRCDLARALGSARDYQACRKTASLFTERMFVGGAERQLSYLAAGLVERGWSVSLWGHAPPSADAAHYEVDLVRRGVEVGCSAFVEEVARNAFVPWLVRTFDRATIEALWQVPPLVLPQSAAFLKVILERRPELVVAYQDRAMAGAGIAAMIAGVPHVLLSGRNVAPDSAGHEPPGAVRVYRDLFRELARFPNRLRISANSGEGARRYACWLDLSEGQVSVIHNALGDEMYDGDATTISNPHPLPRDPDDAPMILGVFRFFPQKKPLDWIAVIRRLKDRDERVTAVLCGDGPLRHEVERETRRLGLEETIKFAGVVSDLRPLYRGASALLLTSAYEGLPNVVLEAQALGCPVVATQSGGTRECVYPAHRDRLFKTGDVIGMSDAILGLIDRKAPTGERAAVRRWLRDNFSVEKLVRETLGAIRALPDDAAASSRE